MLDRLAGTRHHPNQSAPACQATAPQGVCVSILQRDWIAGATGHDRGQDVPEDRSSAMAPIHLDCKGQWRALSEEVSVGIEERRIQPSKQPCRRLKQRWMSDSLSCVHTCCKMWPWSAVMRCARSAQSGVFHSMKDLPCCTASRHPRYNKIRYRPSPYYLWRRIHIGPARTPRSSAGSSAKR
jgi:hypothetical protein